MLFLVYAPRLVYADLPKTHAFMILDSLYTIFFFYKLHVFLNYVFFMSRFLKKLSMNQNTVLCMPSCVCGLVKRHQTLMILEKLETR